jgi:hypothetical protein
MPQYLPINTTTGTALTLRIGARRAAWEREAEGGTRRVEHLGPTSARLVNKALPRSKRARTAREARPVAGYYEEDDGEISGEGL